jgi:lipopolysaccharide/colanic/teichoic acid biosynthesis glycosyltransferase
MDVIIGSLLAIVATPIILLLAVLVALQFRAWPFFTQFRVGHGGQPFRIIKLRTLPVRAPAYADKYSLQEIALPRLARLLRSSHLDELPQLWLVPLGRMTLVGPRPEMDFLHQQLPEYAAAARLSVRPGCTGLWQISEAARGLIHEHTEYDLTYVANQSLRLDLWIMWRTGLFLVMGARPTTLEALPAWVAPKGTRTVLRREHQLAS